MGSFEKTLKSRLLHLCPIFNWNLSRHTSTITNLNPHIAASILLLILYRTTPGQILRMEEKWRATENDPSSDFYNKMTKLSNYIGVEFTLSKYIKLNLWGSYQTGYDRDDDLIRNRYAAEASLNFVMSKRVIWINRFAYFYDAQPVIAINPAFYQLMNGLRITF